MDLIVQGLARKFQAERGLDALQDDELFETFAAHCVVSQFFEGEFDPDRLRMGQGGDLGIDAVAVLLNGELFTDVVEVKAAAAAAHELRAHFVIIQAKTSHFQTKVFTDLADNLVHIFTAKTLTYECSDEVRDLRAAIDAVYSEVGKLSPELPRLSVWYAATGTLRGDGLLEEKRQAAGRRLEGTDRFGSVDVHAVGAREIRELYQRSTDAVSATIMDKRVTLPNVPGIKQAFLGLIPAREIVDRMLTNPAGGMRRTLFYENVRDFQDYNAVNQEIQHTLRDRLGRRQFAVLNNGITIVTRKLTTAGDKFQLRDFQIVNGCQTCHVLFDEREALDDTVFVNLRLIESTDEGVISRIIKATNQQTAVSEDDLSARDEFHRQLEDFFANQPDDRRLLLERRSKQYTARPDVEKTRIVTRSDSACVRRDVPRRDDRYRALQATHEHSRRRPFQDDTPPAALLHQRCGLLPARMAVPEPSAGTAVRTGPVPPARRYSATPHRTATATNPTRSHRRMQQGPRHHVDGGRGRRPDAVTGISDPLRHRR